MEQVKVLVYVLAHNEETLAKAQEEYGAFPWAKTIILPQTIWLENVMYVSYLMEHYDEWKDMDYVGTIAYSASTKQPLVHRMQEICENAKSNGSDVIGLLYRGDPLVVAAERWHPGFTQCWLAAWKSIGFTNDNILLHESIKSFYANYWLSKPQFMTEYCKLMAYFDFRVRTDSLLKGILWRDSKYETRGKNIAKMPVERKMALWEVPYYPQLIFVAERMICLFTSLFSTKTCFLR